MNKSECEHRVFQLLGIKPHGINVDGKPYWFSHLKENWVELGDRIEEILKGKEVITVKTNARIVGSMKKDIRNYLQKHYAGKTIYIPRQDHRATRKTMKDAIKVLRKSKFSNKEICKVMHIYPSWLVKIDKEG